MYKIWRIYLPVLIIILLGVYLSACATNSEINESDEVTIKSIESKEINGLNIDVIDVNASLNITWPDIYENYVVYSNYNYVTGEKRNVHLLNIQTLEDEIIYSSNDTEYDYVIDDVRIGDGWIFWIEGHWTTSATKDWIIKAYNIESKEIIEVRKSTDLLGFPSLTPRIDNEENTIVWLEGYTDINKNLKHTVYSYNVDRDSLTLISDEVYVENPFEIYKPRNNTICFTDNIDNTWVVRIIDLDTQEEMTFETEYHENNCCDGEILVWKQDGADTINNLYYMDLEEQEEVFIRKSVFSYDIYNGNIYYSVSGEKHHIYQYNVANGTTICLTKTTEPYYDNIWFEFYNFYNEKMVCILDRDIYNSRNKLIDNSYVVVIVDGIE